MSKIWYKQSEEHKKKIWLSLIWKWKWKKLTIEHKQKISIANIWKKRSEESKKKMRLRKHSEETKKKILESRKRYKHSEESKKKMSISLLWHKISEETKKKISKSKKWKNYWRIYLKNTEWNKRKIYNKIEDWTINYWSLKDIYENQYHKCKLCWIDLQNIRLIYHNWKNVSWKHLDHIIPLSKWWKHTIYNVQYLCWKCNIHKHAKMPIQQLSIFNI